MDDLVTFSSSALPESTRVVALRGREAISKPYEFELFLTASGPETEQLDLADAIGAEARVLLDRKTDALPPVETNGVLAQVELLHAYGGRVLLRALLVPRFWQLGLSRHSRVFTKKSVVDILGEVLRECGFKPRDYELRLGSYEPEEHVCQYRESDLAFLSRWLEREGIYYFFEHKDGAEKIIFADAPSYPPDALGSPVVYHPQTGSDRSAGPSFRAFMSRHASLPSQVKLTDYDYAKPGLDVSGASDVSNRGTGEVADYGGRFFTPEAGKRLAGLRAEEMLARQAVYHGEGTRTHLRAGHKLELDRHPVGSLNQAYLAIEVRHFVNQMSNEDAWLPFIQTRHEEVYFVEVDAIAASVPFRPVSTTPWPRIYGYENGTVDGPVDDEYAQIDDQGRYLVRFKFDESTQRGGKASTWVRMMQPHGGGIEGFHFPLRKNTEVVFSFLGGDPDRPVIAGVVPNALTPSPVTSGNHTKNVIQTGGRNRLELEDLAGQQRVTLSTPYSNTYLRMGSSNDDHELIIRTDDNTLLDAGRSYDLTVGMQGGGSWSATIVDDWKTMVGGGRLTGVGVSLADAPVGGDDKLVANGNIRREAMNGKFEVKAPKGMVDFQTKGDFNVKVTSENTKFDTAGHTEIKSEGEVKLHSAGAIITILADGNISITSSSGAVTIDSPKKMVVTSPKIELNGAQVATKAAGWFKEFTPMSGETYGFKTASGLVKEDNTALSIAINGVKRELTTAAFGNVGYKSDTTGIKVDNVVLYTVKNGVSDLKGALSTKQKAVCIGTFGFKKL